MFRVIKSPSNESPDKGGEFTGVTTSGVEFGIQKSFAKFRGAGRVSRLVSSRSGKALLRAVSPQGGLEEEELEANVDDGAGRV